MATMIEEYHPQEQELPDQNCSFCNKKITTQSYTLVLERPNVTRTWYFDSLSHLRQWSAPVRG